MSFVFNPLTGQLDRVRKSTGGSSPWSTFTETALASTTTALDTIAIGSFNTIKYILSIVDNTNNQTATLETIVKNANGAIDNTVGHQMKGGISYKLLAVNDAGDFKLNLQNNELTDLTVNIAKIII